MGNETSVPKRPLRMLALVDMAYPTQHAVMNEVFAERMEPNGVELRWVMCGQEELRGQPWRNSRVWTHAGQGLRTLWAMVRVMITSAVMAICWRPQWILTRDSVLWETWGVVLRFLSGGKLMYQSTFLFPETYAQLARQNRRRGWLLKNWMWRCVRILRDAVMRDVDLVLPNTPTLGALYQQKGVRADRFWVLPMGAVVDEIPDRQSVEALRKDLGLQQERVLLYFGAIDPIRRLDVLLEAMPKVFTSLPDVVLLMLGRSSRNGQALLEDQARSLGILDRIRFCPPVPRNEVPVWVAASDATVSPIPLDPLFIISSPTKTVESIAFGTPVIVSPVPDQKELVENSGGGVCVDFTPEAQADGIVEVLRDPAGWREKALAARAHVRKTRDYGVLARNLAMYLGAQVPEIDAL